MKTQQAAEREEQQRIKNLVLNYDLNDDDQHDGTASALAPIVQPSINSKKFAKVAPKIGFEQFNNTLTRADRNGRAPRARRLNLSDVDWYGRHLSKSPASHTLPKADENAAPVISEKKPG